MRILIERVKTGEKSHRTNGKRCSAVDSDLLTFEPWFLPQKTAYAIRQLLPEAHLKKMLDYYAEYGCIRCNQNEGPYGGNGFCKVCRTRLQRRIWGCVKRRADTLETKRYGLRFLQDVVDAQNLLKGFPSEMFVDPQSRPGKRYGVYNPARAAFLGANKYRPQE